MIMKRSWVMTAAALSLLLTVAGSAMAADGPAEAVRADGAISVEGMLEYTDLEGGFYTVGGWGLIGDQDLYKAMQGQKVIVTGKEFTGISTRMVKQIEVQVVAVDVAAVHVQPGGVTVAGKALSFDQGPVVVNGTLMLPLRAVVEGAGGTVEWVEATKSVNVTLPDRKATFVIGEEKAELNENGHYYLVRNMLPMAQAPVLQNGRTLISADAVTKILGLVERADRDQNLDLMSHTVLD